MNPNEAQIAKAPPLELFQLVTDQWTKPYWDAAAEHRLVGARCARCGKFRMPPTPFCRGCRSQDICWVQLSGKGTLYTYTTIFRGMVPGLEAHVPYVVGVVSLPDAGSVRLIANIVGAPLDKLRIGAALSVCWADRPDGVSVPQFVLDE